MTPTDRLVDRCASASPDALEAGTVEALKRHLLDHLGLVVGGHARAESTPAFLAGVEGLCGADGGATSLATGERRAVDHAALLNGAFAHSLDFDDTHRASSLHPGAPVIPAALALAERRGASTGRLLAAVDAGYDVACTVGRAVNPDAHYDRGFHITATCGTFGATAAAGVAAGLDPDEFAGAFGINASQAAGSLQFLENGAWNKRLHPGLAASRAVRAVSLAAGGFRGAAEPIEGTFGFFNGYTEDPDYGAFDALGDRPAVLETGLKPYPCCRYMHPAIDGLLGIAGDVDPDAVTSVRIELPGSGVTLTGDPIERKRRPENFVDCQFSMPFGAALALSRGAAGLEAFLDAQSDLEDPAVRRLMDATEVTATEAVQSVFPERWAARVVVETDGDRHERFVDAATGEPEKPMSWDEIEGKFAALTDAAGWSNGRREAAVGAVRDLESSTLEDLLAAFRRRAAV